MPASATCLVRTEPGTSPLRWQARPFRVPAQRGAFRVRLTSPQSDGANHRPRGSFHAELHLQGAWRPPVPLLPPPCRRPQARGRNRPAPPGSLPGFLPLAATAAAEAAPRWASASASPRAWTLSRGECLGHSQRCSIPGADPMLRPSCSLIPLVAPFRLCHSFPVGAPGLYSA